MIFMSDTRVFKWKVVCWSHSNNRHVSEWRIMGQGKASTAKY